MDRLFLACLALRARAWAYRVSRPPHRPQQMTLRPRRLPACKLRRSRGVLQNRRPKNRTSHGLRPLQTPKSRRPQMPIQQRPRANNGRFSTHAGCEPPFHTLLLLRSFLSTLEQHSIPDAIGQIDGFFNEFSMYLLRDASSADNATCVQIACFETLPLILQFTQHEP